MAFRTERSTQGKMLIQGCTHGQRGAVAQGQLRFWTGQCCSLDAAGGQEGHGAGRLVGTAVREGGLCSHTEGGWQWPASHTAHATPEPPVHTHTLLQVEELFSWACKDTAGVRQMCPGRGKLQQHGATSRKELATGSLPGRDNSVKSQVDLIQTF